MPNNMCHFDGRTATKHEGICYDFILSTQIFLMDGYHNI